MRPYISGGGSATSVCLPRSAFADLAWGGGGEEDMGSVSSSSSNVGTLSAENLKIRSSLGAPTGKCAPGSDPLEDSNYSTYPISTLAIMDMEGMSMSHLSSKCLGRCSHYSLIIITLLLLLLSYY